MDNANVTIEIEKNKFLKCSIDNAIEIAVNEYFRGNIIKINNKNFDIMQYGNYKEKLLAE